MTTKIAYTVCVLTALGLLFIGARFLLDPVAAEYAYGIRLDTHGDFSFHYIKGFRDLFSGLLVLLLVLFRQRKALGISLLAALVVPLGDMLLVLGKNNYSIAPAIPHLTAVLICAIIGPLLLVNRKARKPAADRQLRVISSARNGGDTIVESAILPGDKTPWHYHTLFAETFEVLQGSLQVGKAGRLYQLNEGESITINAHETHLFNNISGKECIVRTSIRPGNYDFEKAGLILTGLAADRATNAAGVPRKLSDLAVFLQLNNSKMTGMLRLVTPLFRFLARRATRNGRLDYLTQRYCSGGKI